MAKPKTEFVCTECGFSSPKWLGKCPECQQWNSLAEETSTVVHKGSRSRSNESPRPLPITEISEEKLSRIRLPLNELDRVLGGGLTVGSVVLLAGDPGIGKSTLMLQLLGLLAAKPGKPLLYISGEESARQLRLRAERLGLLKPRLQVLPETNLSEVLSRLTELSPEIVVVDSVQTLYWPDLSSVPGSVGQVREVADRLVRMAKEKDITMILVGHVTKEGGIAGPMTLEHLVDTVLYFEGEKGQPYRILRAQKNRFGPTDEVGVFDMHEEGLKEVANPSELFLRDRPAGTPGSVVFPAMEGSRPLLVEVQGLASRTSYAVPIRAAVGFDKNRLSMLLAVLEKRAGLKLWDQDVHVNIVGGIRLDEPAADLAVVWAVASSFLNQKIPAKAVCFGEVGLAGEVRAVQSGSLRLREAAKLGFEMAMVPPRGLESTTIQLKPITSVDELFALLKNLNGR